MINRYFSFVINRTSLIPCLDTKPIIIDDNRYFYRKSSILSYITKALVCDVQVVAVVLIFPDVRSLNSG